MALFDACRRAAYKCDPTAIWSGASCVRKRSSEPEVGEQPQKRRRRSFLIDDDARLLERLELAKEASARDSPTGTPCKGVVGT